MQTSGTTRDPLTVRPALLADIPAILAINAAGQPGVSALVRSELLSVLHEAAVFVVAEADRAVAGYLIGYAADGPSAGEEFTWFQRHLSAFLYIAQIAVAATHRRRHVGTRLYGYATDYAGQERLRQLVCEVNLVPPNPGSLAFHRGLGFAEMGVLAVQDGRTVALLSKQLPDGHEAVD